MGPIRPPPFRLTAIRLARACAHGSGPPPSHNGVFARVSISRRATAIVIAVGAILIVGAVLAFTVLRSPSDRPPAAQGRHVWLILMENRADTSIIGSRNAPYLNGLIGQFGTAASYRALVHGSQPNYIALFSGALHGVKGNEIVSIHASNIADQVESAGKTWKVYAQNVPPNCYAGETATGGPDGPGTYARKHEPAISFSDITDSPSRCANIADFTSFAPTAADFEFIVPNLESDMHNGTTREGDDFLRSFVPRILATSAWKSGSPLFITWDEGKQTGENKVLTLVIANTVPAGYRSIVPHTHYSLLRTIEELLGLPCLAQSCNANTLAEFFPGVLSQPSLPAAASP